MKKSLLSCLIVVVGVGAAAGVSAFEGPWLSTLERLEQRAVQAESEADQVRQRWAMLDEILAVTLTDADTARRATETLRLDVAEQVVLWEIADRKVARVRRSSPGFEGRALEQALAQSRGPASQGAWREKVELLADVADGVEHAGQLLVRRGMLTVEHAELRSEAEKTRAERALVLQLVSTGAGGQALVEEVEESQEELDEKVQELNDNPTREDFHRRKGALIPPVAVSPAHLFGPRKQAGSMSFVRHTGLTYEVEEGTEVRSVAPGLVVHAGRLTGYGNLVIIDHGTGYHTLYAHLSELNVEVGQNIAARQVLGLSGQTGSLDGPKLYFELRQRGLPVDPVEWFVRRE